MWHKVAAVAMIAFLGYNLLVGEFSTLCAVASLILWGVVGSFGNEIKRINRLAFHALIWIAVILAILEVLEVAPLEVT